MCFFVVYLREHFLMLGLLTHLIDIPLSHLHIANTSTNRGFEKLNTPPLCLSFFSLTGRLGPAATTSFKRLASLLSAKWDQSCTKYYHGIAIPSLFLGLPSCASERLTHLYATLKFTPILQSCHAWIRTLALVD